MPRAYVYILCSQKNGTLYTGVTNNIHARLVEHKTHINETSFSTTYNATRLVWFEAHESISEAIRREKRLKKWRREWKVALIEENNPDWNELRLSFDD